MTHQKQTHLTSMIHLTVRTSFSLPLLMCCLTTELSAAEPRDLPTVCVHATHADEQPATPGAGPVAYTVTCDGSESGGTGATSCGTPPSNTRDYAYMVTDVDGQLTDVYIATDDPRAANYTSLCLPDGWTFTVEAVSGDRHAPRKTSHGASSSFPDLTGDWVIHFADNTPGDGLLGTGLPSAFVFGFNHPQASHDVGWRAQGTNGETNENWNAPVGSGAGPVHAPTIPLLYCIGTESGGDGSREYEYRVVDHSVSVTDVFIATDDPDEAHYDNQLLPSGWMMEVIEDGDPLNHELGKTAHGDDSAFTGHDGRWVMHFSGLPVTSGEFHVGFNHAAPSHDVGWRVANAGGASTNVVWSLPVGTGAGPVHGPARPAVFCDGAASGGAGALAYEYLVEDHSLTMTDFFVSTDDAQSSSYTSITTPTDWTFEVVEDAVQIDHGLGKTAHGGDATFTGHAGRFVIHFNGPAGFPDGAGRFGFDHPAPPHDLGWRAQYGDGSNTGRGRLGSAGW